MEEQWECEWEWHGSEDRSIQGLERASDKDSRHQGQECDGSRDGSRMGMEIVGMGAQWGIGNRGDGSRMGRELAQQQWGQEHSVLPQHPKHPEIKISSLKNSCPNLWCIPRTSQRESVPFQCQGGSRCDPGQCGRRTSVMWGHACAEHSAVGLLSRCG